MLWQYYVSIQILLLTKFVSAAVHNYDDIKKRNKTKIYSLVCITFSYNSQPLIVHQPLPTEHSSMCSYVPRCAPMCPDVGRCVEVCQMTFLLKSTIDCIGLFASVDDVKNWFHVSRSLFANKSTTLANRICGTCEACLGKNLYVFEVICRLILTNAAMPVIIFLMIKYAMVTFGSTLEDFAIQTLFLISSSIKTK